MPALPHKALPKITPYLAVRFLMKVDIRGADECWPWTGIKDQRGYGRIKIYGYDVRATRVAMAMFSQDPETLVVCHKCDNPVCVNPMHLFLGTVGDNNRDMWTKGRGVPNLGRGYPEFCKKCGHHRTDDYYDKNGPYSVRRCRKCVNARDAKKRAAKKTQNLGL